MGQRVVHRRSTHCLWNRHSSRPSELSRVSDWAAWAAAGPLDPRLSYTRFLFKVYRAQVSPALSASGLTPRSARCNQTRPPALITGFGPCGFARCFVIPADIYRNYRPESRSVYRNSVQDWFIGIGDSVPVLRTRRARSSEIVLGLPRGRFTGELVLTAARYTTGSSIKLRVFSVDPEPPLQSLPSSRPGFPARALECRYGSLFLGGLRVGQRVFALGTTVS